VEDFACANRQRAAHTGKQIIQQQRQEADRNNVFLRSAVCGGFSFGYRTYPEVPVKEKLPTAKI
jgi:hypothetical protein